MRRETNNDRQQRLFVTGLLISAVVGALIGLLWPLWFPACSIVSSISLFRVSSE